MGEALTLTMGTMGDAVADGELRAVRTCVLGPVEAHASGRENRDMRESRDHVRSTCRARGAGGRHTTHAHGRAFDPGAPRPQPYIVAASDVYLCSPLLVSLTFSTVSWP